MTRESHLMLPLGILFVRHNLTLSLVSSQTHTNTLTELPKKVQEGMIPDHDRIT